MPERKQFKNIPEVNPELRRALEQARNREVSEEELREQRISFAYGNASLNDENVTKDSVRLVSDHIKLT